MDYLITFLEGIITFISPCLLPMLPIYLAYFAGGLDDSATAGKAHTLKNALGFVLGFTIVFVTLGAFAGSIGSLLSAHRTVVNIICGIIVIVFGLHFSGLIHIDILNRTLKPQTTMKPAGFWPTVLFGIVFAIGWTPCVGAFLGSALLLAAQQASALHGIILLICYSLGLGIPFVLCAVIIGKLEGAFAFIKRHYRVINIICGVALIIVGILMATGLLNALLGKLAII